MTLYEGVLRHRNVVQAASFLAAWRRGEDSPEAFAGAMLEAAAYLSLLGGSDR